MESFAKELFTGMVRDSGMPVTESDMRAEWEKLNQGEGSLIRNDSSFSPFWRLITSIVTRPAQWLVNLLVEDVLPNSFLRFASGVYLDVYAWGLNLVRKGSAPARGRVVFTRATATGELNIPGGVYIETPPVNGVVYRVKTLAPAVIPNGDIALEVLVEAEEHGEAWNLGAGYYSILSQPINGIVDVTNPADWLDTPGADTEKDDALRLRCRNQFAAVGQLHHDAAYKALIAAFTGVRIDYLYFEARQAVRGPGTANCYVMIESGPAPQTLCDAINGYIMDGGNHGHGDDLLCLPIPEQPEALVVTVHAVDEAGAERRAVLLEEVENRIRCAFRQNTAYNMTTPLPQSRFSFSRLGDELHAALPDLKSVEFHRGEDIVSLLTLPVLERLDITMGAAA
ncbi:MAG: baseplate J/gp47 family protein [Desulfovibrio desulfuricans]|nr:baseplate J/gp47 family protein [Desulfovibrio desulfuricans]